MLTALSRNRCIVSIRTPSRVQNAVAYRWCNSRFSTFALKIIAKEESSFVYVSCKDARVMPSWFTLPSFFLIFGAFSCIIKSYPQSFSKLALLVSTRRRWIFEVKQSKLAVRVPSPFKISSSLCVFFEFRQQSLMRLWAWPWPIILIISSFLQTGFLNIHLLFQRDLLAKRNIISSWVLFGQCETLSHTNFYCNLFLLLWLI